MRRTCGDFGGCFGSKTIAIRCFKARRTASPPAVFRLRHDDASFHLPSLCGGTVRQRTNDHIEPTLDRREAQRIGNARAELVKRTRGKIGFEVSFDIANAG